MASLISCPNRPMFAKCMKIVREKLVDVNFTFESNNIINDNDANGPPAKNVARKGKSTVDDNVGNDVKLSANKEILAASSPVFNAMFNGPLKETGDVKIVDVPPDAFREFLQIFYETDVKLTMENLGDVMKLVDKYDVEDGWPIMDTVFKRLTVNDILWGLHLAVTYQRADWITHCTNVIEQNSAKVCDMIKFDGSGKPRLRSNPNKRPMTDTDLANIFSRIYEVMTKHISESVPAKAIGIVSLHLQTSNIKNLIVRMGNISFSSNHTLHLTHIFYGEVSKFDKSRLQCEVKVSIAETETYHTIPVGGGSIEYVNPVLIKANQKYTIQTTIITEFSCLPLYCGFEIPSEPLQMTPDIQIVFDKAPYAALSLVGGMNFLRYDQ